MYKYLYLAGLVFLMVSCVNQQNLESKKNIIQYEKPLTFDFSKLGIFQARAIPGMNSVSPNGDEIKVNSNYITKNGRPWIPSYGEFHYQRYPANQWEDALIKMKAQGFDGVSAYVLWIAHEETEGEWNFSGNNDLRRFIQLCQKHGLKFFARIGPWVNGEIRNGGHPDWLVARLGNPKNPFNNAGRGGKLRTMDPEYLMAVDKLYQKLAEQMEGLYWKDGGPIYGIQLDNEFSKHVSHGDPSLINWEKETALKYGMGVPLYTITGWAHAPFTQDNTIPTYGTYADYFWIGANQKHVTEAFTFSTVRATSDIDTEVNEGNQKMLSDKNLFYDANPYLTSETGIGMDMTYHRRTNLNHLDNAAVSLVEFGSGANGLGYFMNVGGNNPKGKLLYMNRNIEEGSSDNGVISRDFQAAIGEFGQVRKSFHELAVQLHFMRDFGKYVAPCKTFIPKEIDEKLGHKLDDTKKLQRAVRTDGRTGFIFVNNHVMHNTAYQFNDIQFEIKLKDEILTIPENPVNISVDAYFLWPFNLTLDGVTIKYASAQPVMSLDESDTYVFFQNEGIPAEFVFDNSNIEKIETKNSEVSKSGSTSKISVKKAGLDCYFDVKQKGGKKMRFLVLTQAQAKQLYKNNDKLYISDAEVLMFDNPNNTLQVISQNTSNTIWVYPANTVDGVETDKEGVFDKFTVDFDEQNIPFTNKETKDGKSLSIENRIFKRGPKFTRIARPLDSIWHKGTVVEIALPEGVPNNLYDVRITVDYKASALRFYKNGVFTYDNYYNGNPFELSTKHILSDYSKEMKLEFKFLPLQPNDPIYIAGKYWPDLKQTENVLEINSIKVVPVYTESFKLNKGKKL